jgi:polysaccharide export outer membrane protein
MLARAPYSRLITGYTWQVRWTGTAGSMTPFRRGDGNLAIWSWLRTLARPTAMVLGLGLIAGCQAVPGDGPWMNDASSRSTEALPFDVIDLTPTTVVAYRAPTSIDVPSTTSNLSAGGRVAVAPGDVLKVRIFEPYEGSIFPTIQKPGADLGAQRVTDEGTIEVPYVGIVSVRGLNLSQIEQRIGAQLTSNGKAQDPQVIVEFVADRTHTVMVSGDVKTPGRISLLDGVRTVVDAINRVGGPAQDKAAQLEVVLRRNGQVVMTAQYSDLLAGRDAAVQKGDEIVVRPNSRTFTVLGAVQKAGNVDLTKANLTLLEALGAVGGLNDERANKTGVFVFRMGDLQNDPNARGRVFRLDLNQPVSIFIAQQFGVQPRDVLYVTNAPLYEYNKILTAIYRTFSIVGIVKGNLTTATTF